VVDARQTPVTWVLNCWLQICLQNNKRFMSAGRRSCAKLTKSQIAHANKNGECISLNVNSALSTSLYIATWLSAAYTNCIEIRRSSSKKKSDELQLNLVLLRWDHQSQKRRWNAMKSPQTVPAGVRLKTLKVPLAIRTRGCALHHLVTMSVLMALRSPLRIPLPR